MQVTIILNSSLLIPAMPSIIGVTKLVSTIPRSFENLLMRTPEGVESKKSEGLRTIAVTIF